MDEVRVLPSFVFVAHGYVQRGVCGWCGSHCARFYTYVIPGLYHLSDAIAFAYEVSIDSELRADALSMKKGSGSGEAYVDEKNSEDGSYKNNNEKNPELSDSHLEIEGISEED